jgi:hypothetical protein
MSQQSTPLPRDIRSGLKYLNNDQDVRAIEKKFHDQSQDRRQWAHTKMELIAGVFCARMGFTPRYEPKMGGQTPDWLLLDHDGNTQFFTDVCNFHNNEVIERKIEEAMTAGQPWGGDLPDSCERLYPVLKQKAGKYKDLAKQVKLPFVVFIYGWFESFLHPKEFDHCLRNVEWGIFKDYPHLTGVYHFDDASQVNGERDPGYLFRFYANPYASRSLKLNDGLVPVPIPDPT